MKQKDAATLIRAIARATKSYFARRADHDQLVQRVAELERQIAELKSKSEEA